MPLLIGLDTLLPVGLRRTGRGFRDLRALLRWAPFLFLFVSLTVSACGRSSAVVVIAPHPTKSHILYVATNEYIYKSRDEGRTWENISEHLSHSRVISMGIDPTYPATVYAGTKGDAVFKSFDGGQRWVSKRSGLDDVTISSVVNQFVFDPSESRRIFVATTMGVFETRNGGDSWHKRMEGMKEVLMVVTLAVDLSNPEILYAGTSGGVYKSHDRAAHWEKANSGLVPATLVKSSRALGVTVIQVDPHDPATVYAATMKGLYKSTDHAASWTRIGESLPDQMISAMVLDRIRKNVLYVASRAGVYESLDGGKAWSPKNEGLASLNIRSLAQSPIHGETLYAGTNGSGLYRSRDAGGQWEPVPLVSAQTEPKPKS